MAPTPGLLYVTMQPKTSLALSQFHDWYNNEHGPTRLRLPFVTNGFRYRASDLQSPSEASESKPEWMACYDITDMAALTQDTYLRLRDQPVKSKREAEIMAQIKVDRKLYDFVESRESSDFKVLEKVENEGTQNVLVAVFLELKNEEGARDELNKWYIEEHIPMLSKVPGWLRTRRYVTSSIDKGAKMEHVSLHEYSPMNGLTGPEFKAVTSTPWAKKVMTEVVENKGRRVYNSYYTFGPAPRYLSPNLADWQRSDEKASMTLTHPDSLAGKGQGAIESFVTTPDGVELPYRLEGCSDPSAPLIILCNSILVDYRIWEAFLSSFFSKPENMKYRVLRYLTRGRFSASGTQKITVDLLASDIISILDALRVKQAAAIIGVSLGGATTLNAVLKYPNRVASFISCDTSSKSPAGNAKAWGDRIAIAEKEAAATSSGEAIVGTELAEMTTRRWFVSASFEDKELEKTLLQVKEMVATNSLQGFKQSVEALFDYDLREEMKSATVGGMFVVGGSDGVLPGTMKEMAGAYGKGARYEVIEGAGHLPMVEKPEKFAEVVGKFLN